MRITDNEVGQLPIAQGRVELLEEIMSTPVVDRTTAEPRGPRSPRRAPVLIGVVAAAAAVLATVFVPGWLAGGGPGTTLDAQYGAPGGDPDGDRAVLTGDGWRVDHVNESETEGEIRYVEGDRNLSIHWRPAPYHADYVADRGDVGAATGLTFLGEESLMWAYDTKDHTVIRPVEGDHFLEVRGQGMSRDAYLALLDRVQQVDEAGFAAALPADVVTPETTGSAVAGMLADIPKPPGFDPADVEVTGFNIRYHVGAAVTGTVACGWIKEYDAGQKADDQGRVDRAVAAMQSSRDWKILTEMEAGGDWSDVVWSTADEMKAGDPARLILERSGFCPEAVQVEGG